MASAVVCADIAPLYAAAEPGTLIDEALFGMTVEVKELKGDFCRIVTHYHYEGWTHRACLCFEAAPGWEAACWWVVTRPYADVLDAPKVQGTRLAGVPRGGFLAPGPENEQKGWCQVLLPDGRCGWLPRTSLAPRKTQPDFSNREALRQALCDSALSYLGAQYRWGGKTMQGIDCSGLVSMAYMLNGIIIFRDARIEEGFAIRPIPVEEVRKGDLLFFPGHVAMYLGGGKFIHSTGHEGGEGCRIASFIPDDPAYRPDLRGNITAAGSIF